MKRAALLLSLASDPAGAAHPFPAVPDPRALENGHIVTSKVISGAQPEGERSFRALQALGVRTILSVDGARPDVAGARRFGMTYVHLPIGYDGVDEAAGKAIAKALVELPGKIYVHCHHGKHRGPAAAAAAIRALHPECSAADAVAYLKRAGTDPKYAGLFAAVERAPAIPAGGADQLPEVASVPDLTKRMVEIDHTWAALTAAKAFSVAFLAM